MVHDKHGNPVTNLKQEDFVLKDEGKSQQIKLFVNSEAEVSGSASSAQPPNIFSNRRGRGAGTTPAVAIVLFDVLNTRVADQVAAKEQLLAYLGTIHRDDRVALYVLGRDLVVLHDFTDDAAHLAHTLENLHVRIPSELQSSLEIPLPGGPGFPGDLDHLADESNRRTARVNEFESSERARLTISAMQSIANHVAFIPGRKSLVWLSSSFPFALNPVSIPPPPRSRSIGLIAPAASPVLFADEIRSAVRAVNQAGLAIYPVDSGGMSVRGITSSSGEFETMDLLAGGTGGVAYRNTNDLTRAVQQAVDDGRVSYTLGFYPQADSWDGKFHSISVAVKRPGIEIRCAKDYLAANDAASSSAERIQQRIGSALLSPLDSTVIGMRAGIEAVDRPAPGNVRVVLQIEPADLTLMESGGHWTGSIEYVLMEQKADGTPLQTTNEELSIDLTKERHDAILQRGFLLTRYLRPSPDGYRLRAVVLDHPTGNLGSVSIPLDGVIKH